jgi:hypothetical protein
MRKRGIENETFTQSIDTMSVTHYFDTRNKRVTESLVPAITSYRQVIFLATFRSVLAAPVING